MVLSASLSAEPAVSLAQWPAPAGDLTPPAGNTLFLTAKGIGTQDYICLPSEMAGNANAWVFERPQASLSVTIAGIPIEVAQHLLSPVPGRTLVADPACVEAGVGAQQLCPSWQNPLDQSEVWGQRIASETAGSSSDCPHPGAIACLLLKSVATSNGQFASGLLGAVTYIERDDTVGGVAPTTTCRIGQVAQVPYSASYLFFKAKS